VVEQEVVIMMVVAEEVVVIEKLIIRLRHILQVHYKVFALQQIESHLQHKHIQ
tara:strand:- start:632 stop:790 length:159 start_codon:yes stop_codon:yes gene_type:complete